MTSPTPVAPFPWNDTAAPFRADACLHQLFEQQAARTPRALAVVDGMRRYDYAELERRANRLARRLRAAGVGRETLVGIALERSFEMVVAVFAVLKAGGAYVPLDPAYPSERIAFMLEETGTPLVVSSTNVLSRLDLAGSPVVDVELERNAIARLSGEALENVAAPADLAYIVYTSGSTGRPKGVMIEHRSVVAFVDWCGQRFEPRQLAGVLGSSSLSFDVSVFELFAPLSFGGSVVLAQNALALPHLPAREEVTLVSTVASALSELVRVDGIPRSVNTIMQAGEFLNHELARRLYERDHVRELINLCGATEDTVYSVSHLVERGSSENPPIGRPFANRKAYVLDEALRPVGPGEAGEIYYAGIGVARGYFNAPELTAERFLENPFATGADDRRMYKSGDLVRYRADGTLEYLQRMDQQVKVRGFRVELGEIEATIARHPAVAENVVAARALPDGQKMLVAYVVFRNGQRLTVDALRAYVAGHLPEYMIPAAMVALDVLPTMPNGKIDRAALPAPGFERPDLASQYVSPQTDTESAVAAVWSALLGIANPGTHDDFFALGGNSLLAAQAVSRVRETCGVELPLGVFFDARTIASQAAAIEHSERAASVVRDPAEALASGPLSYSQEQLWFLDRLVPGRPVYNIAWALRLDGSLDEAAVRHALDVLVERHEPLRTVFESPEGRPVRRVLEARGAPFSLDDLSAAEAGEADALEERIVREEARRPIDLRAGPVFRARLVRRSAERHTLLLTVHHIAFDGWSIGVLLREFAELYRARTEGGTPALGALRSSYEEFVALQRRSTEGAGFARRLAFWTKTLADVPELRLPFDRPRPRAQRFRGARQAVSFSPSRSEQLGTLARRAGATTYMTLLAAFATLLHRRTGQTDIALGSPVAGRTHAQTETLVGFFVNMIVLRNDLSGDPTFLDLLGRVRESALASYAHQDVPFEKIVEALNPERAVNRTPVFNAACVMLDPPHPLAAGDLRVTPRSIDTGTSKFDLTLEISEGAEGLRCEFEYDSDLFEAATIEQLLREFETLLRAIAEDPNRPLSALPMVETAAPPQPAPATALEIPPLRTPLLQRRFEEGISRFGERVALTLGAQRMTHRELDARANQLAALLVKRGVGPEVVVGVCLERSFELVVALLAVLKAGGAYLPLDPQLPPERLRFMAGDARAHVLITRGSLRELVAGCRLPVFDFDADAAELAAAPCEAFACGATPESLAYVIYTSGSTGTPKGVMIEHRNVVRLFERAEELFAFGPDDVWTLFHSFAFDFSVWELWGALSFGARVVIVPHLVARSPGALHGLVADERVTVFNQTPSSFRSFMLADETAPRPLALRYVIFGGEALDIPTLAPWFARHAESAPELVNMYGITETTVHVTFRALRAADAARPARVIGRPLSDLEVVLLDERGREAEPGATGELCVGGAGLARGYVNRPELTAQAFGPHPFRQGARLYRSGDLARRLPAGELEYLGRRDNQVKIRGFRIELGEIESVLAAHPLVRSSAVVATGEAERRLIAYVVPRGGGPVPDDLRTFLSGRLPDYMLPSAIVALEAFPLTSNGKIDRNALPAPERVAPVAAEGAPLTPLARAIATIWEELLGVSAVGPADNFFVLGGHSLLAAAMVARVERAYPQLVRRLEEQYGENALLATFYVEPTVECLAAALAEGEGGPESPLVAIAPGVPDRRALFFLHGIFNGDGFYCWNLARALGGQQPFYAIHPHGHGGSAIPDTIEEMAADRIRAIQSVQPRGPYLLGGFCNGALVAYEMARQLEASGERVERLILISASATNRRFAPLAKAVAAVARVLRMSPRARQSAFIRARGLILRAQAFTRGRLDRKVGLLLAAGRKGLRKMVDVVSPNERDLPAPVDLKTEAYSRAVISFVPQRYGGDMMLIWGREEPFEDPDDPASGWAEVARHVEVRLVEGGHHCVERETEGVARAISGYLAREKRPSSLAPAV